MSILQSIILGIVQGLTEFLPVSSSGHLGLAKAILGIDLENNLFMNVMLHIGTLIAVIIVFRKLVWKLIVEVFATIADIFTGKFKWKKMSDERNLLVMLFIGLLPLFLLFVPIPFTDGLNLKDLAEILSSPKYLFVSGYALMATSALLILGSAFNKRHIKNGTTKTRYNVFDAVVVGLTQLLAAVFPGLSRSGSTLSAGEMRGIDKQAALDYSFVIGIPSIFAAAVLELKDAFEQTSNPLAETGAIPTLIGVIVSGIVGVLAIKLFKWMLKKDRMFIFVIYTAILGLVTVVCSAMGMVK